MRVCQESPDWETHTKSCYVSVNIMCLLTACAVIFEMKVKLDTAPATRETPPMPVPSPDEKGGGLCAGFEIELRKKKQATETVTKKSKDTKIKMLLNTS